MESTFQKKVLKNGITVIHEHRDLPVVSFSIANPFAASHETPEIKGIAHCIEHLLFTGTKTRSHEDISREIEKKGGVLNAFTAQDVTSYWFKLPEEHLFAGMEILIDMLKNPTFDEEKFEKEKKVILEEIKMYHDTPQRHIFEKIEENLFDNPFGQGIAGSKETVSALTRDFVASYFKEKYTPEHYIVTIVGKADFDKVCNYLEEQFEKEDQPLSEHVPIKKKNAHATEERPGIDQAHVVFASHAPMAHDNKKYALAVLDAYLANGMSSKLFLEIREKRGLAYTVHGAINTEKTYSYYSIYVGTTKEAVDQVKELIIQGFKDVEAMTEDDLNEAKERLIGLRKVGSEESANTMNELLFATITGDLENYYKYEELINAVTLESVKELAQNLIKDYSTAAIVPK